MAAAESAGRAKQKIRTRKNLLQAAARLLRQGRAPTLEEIAEEALVSRATAYRYFSSLDELLLEASLDIAIQMPARFSMPGRRTIPSPDWSGSIRRVLRDRPNKPSRADRTLRAGSP